MHNLPIIYLDSNATSFIKLPNQFINNNNNYNIRANKDIELDDLHKSIHTNLEKKYNIPLNSKLILTTGATDSLNIAGYNLSNFYNNQYTINYILHKTIHNSLYSQIYRNSKDFIIYDDIENYLYYNNNFVEVLNIFFNPSSAFYPMKSSTEEINMLLRFLEYNVNLGRINNIVIDLSQYIDWNINLNWIEKIIQNIKHTEYNIFVAFGFHKKLSMLPGAGLLLYWTNNNNSNTLSRLSTGGTGSNDLFNYKESYYPSGTFDISHYLQFDYLLQNKLLNVNYETLLDNYHYKHFSETTDSIKKIINNYLELHEIKNKIKIDSNIYLYEHLEGPDYIFNLVDQYIKQKFNAQIIARTGKFCSTYYFLNRINVNHGYLRIS